MNKYARQDDDHRRSQTLKLFRELTTAIYPQGGKFMRFVRINTIRSYLHARQSNLAPANLSTFYTKSTQSCFKRWHVLRKRFVNVNRSCAKKIQFFFQKLLSYTRALYKNAPKDTPNRACISLLINKSFGPRRTARRAPCAAVCIPFS